MKTYSGLLCFAAIREIRGFLATNVKVRLQREVPLSPDYGLSATEGSTRDSVEDDGPCKSLAELLLPAKDCKVDQMSGTDLGR